MGRPDCRQRGSEVGFWEIGRIRNDKRAWDNASDVVHNPGAMPTYQD